ncbi:carboxy-S-adenosyl-L-methionine synthase CmoA [Sedimenticola selenatireducens]|uniref:Carboxy-S-adenosyl-L-methionine synthase n=1 Tax=Sedimenticola selenatireducens TaxID=191960 RepID=A0A557SMU7_9GAMM|nr:carboxy-S-adenosyl-L-methionine synthase CmoA [Sedimenticola selenatireducens]TVO78747.1 carboxy-S-adenosyl-L-methionine synthase CmoA [Sedimenticola selenatireducens]TVT62109.1 MAG: carboxy-S-adenosyl-L-methionine synthase CmoA [Sedimenticola selenatireducens]
MNQDSEQDRVYSEQRDRVGDFVFDQQVARVFPDMIRRSVPGYATVINLSGVLARQHVQSNSNCYDLGCSLGATSLALQSGIEANGCKIIAVDNSPAMLEQARTRVPDLPNRTPIDWVCDDIRTTPIENASLITLNFTLQFIPVEARKALLTRIQRGLRPGGILVLSEKIAFEDPQEEHLQIEMHHAFKRANGYNDLEISQKRSALENVLIPETLAQHQARLKQAGFVRADIWFQCFNFISLVARK